MNTEYSKFIREFGPVIDFQYYGDTYQEIEASVIHNLKRAHKPVRLDEVKLIVSGIIKARKLKLK
jgi:hypothetical protein